MSAPFWTPARVAALEQMICVEGATFEAAARRLGTTKNACVGKALRTGLRPAPDAPLSPLQRAVRARAERRRRTVARPRLEFPSPGHCLYPFGDPGEEGFHFCGERAEGDGAWCAEHRRAVYVRAELAEAGRAGWTPGRRARASWTDERRAAARAHGRVVARRIAARIVPRKEV